MTKILIIEDEEMIRSNIKELLEVEEFEVWEAENGEIGVHLAQTYKPDLILCDIMMPILDGYDVLEQLRCHPSTATIPFIFMTALSDRTNTRKGMELGADDYISKPCTSTELLKAITVRLEKHSRVQQYYQNQVHKVQEEFKKLIYIDPITNLPNRLALREQFEEIKAKITLEKTQFIPVIAVNIERFRRINEAWGYDSTNCLLKAVGERLKNQFCSKAKIAHLDEEKFILILDIQEDENAVFKMAKNILKNLSLPFYIDDQEILITFSLGIAFYSQDGDEIDDLLHCSQVAVDYAHKQGGNRYECYQKTWKTKDHDQIALENDLRQALEHNQFQLYYQPKVDLKTGQIIGAEALIRWIESKRGFVSPAVFIPLAEEIGLIEPIGEWVLRTACRQTKTWHKLGLETLKMAVNLSGCQFNLPDICPMVLETLLAEDLPSSCLELELTESFLVEHEDASIQKLNRLKALGLKIAIDDFGTGYSSLSYLQQFPFDVLKLDRCFVQNIDQNPKNKIIVEAVIKMAHQLNLEVVAEGVETTAELHVLRQYQCDIIQGYLFSRPIPAQEFQALVESNKSLTL
ncbi:EAL domain-containing response regulator [Lyngbya sp. PCC 8106]|uniref:two-component system response regulator n=1 Tax=Lyngbya sp. (strain PCC 8106) TaxID=313612 RepID=UPI0000EA8BAF|nr:EAL domain-containing response regulator [Lyngbya sp. PCC 8106]EAW37290.1 Hybrid signal transduction histidine kinase and diguanylatecyclase/phosphodiesterase [Lyngbya sp. PCC 8106]